MRTKKLWPLAATLVAIVGCSDGKREAADESTPEAAERPLVYATNYPLAYFAERLGGDLVEVRLLVSGDGDPAYWKPDTEDVLAMQKAALVVLNGASYEAWLKNVSVPPSRMVVTTDALRDRLIPLERETTHSHGLQGEHQHSGTAFTTWLDPTLAAAQAVAIQKAFSARWPEHSGQIEARLAELTQELTALDADTQEAIAGNPVLPVLFSHPVYQYLADRYRLNARSVHWEPDRVPDEAEWQELLEARAEFPASWMIWEETPLPEVSERLESIGIRSVVFDPCASAPASGDFLSVMQENVRALRLVFAADGTPSGA